MSCISQTLSGLVQNCETSKGGIKKVLIATEDPKPNYDNTLKMITSIDNKEIEWYEYNFKKNSSSMVSTLNVDPANGINFVSTELTLQFNKMDTVKRIEMVGLAVNDMWIIVQDCNNKWWYLGFDDVVNASAGLSQTGTAKTDGNFYQITLTDESKTWPIEVKSDALPKIVNINVYTGTSLNDLKITNEYEIEGSLMYGSTITLIVNEQWTKIYDKDTKVQLNENNVPVIQIKLTKEEYNIAYIPYR